MCKLKVESVTIFILIMAFLMHADTISMEMICISIHACFQILLIFSFYIVLFCVNCLKSKIRNCLLAHLYFKGDGKIGSN